MNLPPLSERLEQITEQFDKKFVKHQDLVDASPENKIIYGSQPPNPDTIKSFYRSAITQLVSEVLEEVSEEIESLKFNDADFYKDPEHYWQNVAYADIQSIVKKARKI